MTSYAYITFFSYLCQWKISTKEDILYILVYAMFVSLLHHNAISYAVSTKTI